VNPAATSSPSNAHSNFSVASFLAASILVSLSPREIYLQNKAIQILNQAAQKPKLSEITVT
jgi:hypothetical protein